MFSCMSQTFCQSFGTLSRGVTKRKKKSDTTRKDTHSKAGQKPIKTEPPASAEQTA